MLGLYIRSYIPAHGDLYHSTAGSVIHPTLSPEEKAQRINLNTADHASLTTLPGIGDKLAQQILAYRSERGVFRYAEELLLIHGFGEKKLEAIYNLIYIE